jgi:hypothetical protein
MSQDDTALAVTLNANQRRHYGILISGLEATLEKVEAAVTAPTATRGLMRVAADLPPDFQHGASPILARVRAALQRVTNGLALEVRPVSQRQICRALLTSEINRIEESYSTRLRGYGVVDDSVSDTLDPLLRAVRADLGTLVALLSPTA